LVEALPEPGKPTAATCFVLTISIRILPGRLTVLRLLLEAFILTSGVAALFDTCGAMIKTGFNVAPSPKSEI